MNSPEDKELNRTAEGKLIVRKCMQCDKFLDETSRIAAETLAQVQWIISHGICQPCSDEILLDFRTKK